MIPDPLCVSCHYTSACVGKEPDLAPRPIEDVALLVPLVGAPAHHEQLGGPQRGVQIFWGKNGKIATESIFFKGLFIESITHIFL